MVTITLPPELEQAITEQARQQGTTPETLTLDVLNRWFSGSTLPSLAENQTQNDLLTESSSAGCLEDASQDATFTVEISRKPGRAIRLPSPRLKNPEDVSHLAMQMIEGRL